MNGRLILPQAVYRRAQDPSRLPGDLRLNALAWALFFAVDGMRTCAEIGRELRVEAEAVHDAMARLLKLDLIAEQELDAAGYVRALAAAGDPEEKTLREFLTAATGRASAPQPRENHAEGARAMQPLRAVSPQEPFPEASAPTAPGTTPRPLRNARPAFGFKPLPSPEDEKRENRPMSRTRRLSLRAFMNLIESQASSREAGQLDIYRVFVRVDTLLLKRNGIETLRFTEDRLISDPELEQALVRSVKKTLGIDCPESVWIEVA